MPRLRQFSPQTKSKSRGSVSLLSIVWLVVTIAGVASIARATVVVQQRAEIQTHADSIALAAANYGDTVAREFAHSLNVDVVSVLRDSNTVTVRIRSNRQSATATAFQPL